MTLLHLLYPHVAVKEECVWQHNLISFEEARRTICKDTTFIEAVMVKYFFVVIQTGDDYPDFSNMNR